MRSYVQRFFSFQLMVFLSLFFSIPFTVHSDDGGKRSTQNFFLLPPEIIDSYFPQGTLYFIPDDSSYTNLIERAELFERRNDFRQAAKYYLMAYQKIKMNEKAPYLLFKQSVLLENPQVSIAHLREIIAFYPSFLLIDAVRYELAVRLYVQEDYTGAEEVLQDVLEHEKSGVLIFTPYVFTFLGVISSTEENYDRATEYLNSSLEVIVQVGTFQREQLSIRNYLELAKAMIELEEFEHLQVLLTRILGTAPSELHQQEALILLAKYYELSEDVTRAFWTYSQFIQRFPTSIFLLKAKESMERLNEAGSGPAPAYEPGVFDVSLLTGHYRIGQAERVQSSAELYSIQIGSFSEERNAENLIGELKGQGYSAFSVEAKVDGKKVFRVRVGTVYTPEEAERLMQELSGRGYQGFIVREK